MRPHRCMGTAARLYRDIVRRRTCNLNPARPVANGDNESEHRPTTAPPPLAGRGWGEGAQRPRLQCSSRSRFRILAQSPPRLPLHPLPRLPHSGWPCLLAPASPFRHTRPHSLPSRPVSRQRLWSGTRAHSTRRRPAHPRLARLPDRVGTIRLAHSAYRTRYPASLDRRPRLQRSALAGRATKTSNARQACHNHRPPRHTGLPTGRITPCC